MRPSPPPATPVIESSIARAHRALQSAVLAASTLSDLGLHDDLQLIQLELERIQFSLLRGQGSRYFRGQLKHVSQSDTNRA